MLTHENFLALRFPADAHEVASVRNRLRRWLGDAGFGEDEASDLVLATSEAVNNSVEHAYQGHPGTIELSADVDDAGAVCIAITDNGRWRVPPRKLTTRGRGLLLMRESVDQVVVVRSPHGTSVTLRRSRHPTFVPSARARAHEVDAHETSSGVLATVRGDVPEHATTSLRRTLITLARGGSVPLTVDLTELGDETAGVADALHAVAEAAAMAGNRLTVVGRDGL